MHPIPNLNTPLPMGMPYHTPTSVVPGPSPMGPVPVPGNWSAPIGTGPVPGPALPLGPSPIPVSSYPMAFSSGGGYQPPFQPAGHMMSPTGQMAVPSPRTVPPQFQPTVQQNFGTPLNFTPANPMQALQPQQSKPQQQQQQQPLQPLQQQSHLQTSFPQTQPLQPLQQQPLQPLQQSRPLQQQMPSAVKPLPTTAQQLLERVDQEQYGEEKLKVIQSAANLIPSITADQVRSILARCPFGFEDVVTALYPKMSDKSNFESDLQGRPSLRNKLLSMSGGAPSPSNLLASPTRPVTGGSTSTSPTVMHNMPQAGGLPMSTNIQPMQQQGGGYPQQQQQQGGGGGLPAMPQQPGGGYPQQQQQQQQQSGGGYPAMQGSGTGFPPMPTNIQPVGGMPQQAPGGFLSKSQSGMSQLPGAPGAPGSFSSKSQSAGGYPLPPMPQQQQPQQQMGGGLPPPPMPQQQQQRPGGIPTTGTQFQQPQQPQQGPQGINAATIDPAVLEQAYAMLQKLQDEQRKLSNENEVLQKNLKGLSNKAREAKELEKSKEELDKEILLKEREKENLNSKLSEKDALIAQLQAQLNSLTLVKEDEYKSDLIGRQLEDLTTVEPGLAWDSSAIDAAIGASLGVGVAPRLDAFSQDDTGYNIQMPQNTTPVSWNSFSVEDALGSGFERALGNDVLDIPSWDVAGYASPSPSPSHLGGVAASLENLTVEEIENLSVDDLLALTGGI